MNIVSLGITITVLLILLGIIFPKSKFFAILQLAWIIVLSSGNSGGADYIDNSNIFLTADTHSINGISVTNGVFSFLATTWRDAGLNYIAFNGILALAATVLMGWVILRYAERPALSTAFLLIFPIFDNVIQKRWYPAMAIIIFAVAMLYKQPHSFKRNAAFVLLCLLAVQFHSGVLVYLSIPVFFLIKKRNRLKIAIIMLVIGTAGRSLIPIMLQHISIQGMTDKLELYFSVLAQTSSWTHYAFWVVWQVAQMMIVWLLYKRNSESKFLSYVWQLNIWALIFVPLYTFNPVFTRIYRTVIVFNAIAVGNSIRAPKKNQVVVASLVLTTAQFTMSIVSFLVMDYITSSSLGFNELVAPIFTNNIFLK